MKRSSKTIITVEFEQEEFDRLLLFLRDHTASLNEQGGRGATSEYMADLAATMNGLNGRTSR